MAKFKPGNRMWEIRSSHGRAILFSSPELMWSAAKEYFEWVDNNPLKKQDAKVEDKKITKYNLTLSRPYTWQGLTRYLDCGIAYFNDFKNSDAYKENPDFSTVIERIESIIYQQKFDGAAVGIFNSNIMVRDLGLAEKIKSESTMIVVNQPDDDES
jgi:hypothetical protein